MIATYKSNDNVKRENFTGFRNAPEWADQATLVWDEEINGLQFRKVNMHGSISWVCIDVIDSSLFSRLPRLGGI